MKMYTVLIMKVTNAKNSENFMKLRIRGSAVMIAVMCVASTIMQQK